MQEWQIKRQRSKWVMVVFAASMVRSKTSEPVGVCDVKTILLSRRRPIRHIVRSVLVEQLRFARLHRLQRWFVLRWAHQVRQRLCGLVYASAELRHVRP
jgi:hypothetical protein